MKHVKGDFLVSKGVGVLLLLVMGLVSAGQTQAEIVRDLYSARVQVQDQSAKALAAGASQALADVLVKATGDFEVLDSQAVQDALGQARTHVQQYAYERRAASGAGESSQLWARYEFSQVYVTQLVKDAGAPLWSANRPPVLVWMVMEDSEGRFLVGGDSAPQEAQLLADAFSARGVPLQLPLYDLQDRSAIGMDELWRLQGQALQAASARYAIDDIVAVRVAQLNEGEFLGDWSYLSNEGRLDRSVSATSLEEFLRKGVAMVAEDLAARFAVAVVESSGEGLSMAVSGVQDYGDFAAIISWLRSLELVNSANIASVQGDKITIDLRAEADAMQLAPLIELNENLQPTPGGALSGVLDYQWLQ